MKNNPTYPIMNQCPYISPALQYPASCDSLKVPPNVPYKLPFSDGDYLLHLESFTFDRGASQQWLHRNGNANDILCRSFSMQSMNTSVADIDFPQAYEGSPQLGSGLNTDSFWSHTQPVSQTTQQITLGPRRCVTDVSELFSNTISITQASESCAKMSRKVQGQHEILMSRSLGSTSYCASSISSPDSRPPRIRKLGHSAIEKRYRSNLNEKIALLRDCIPSLSIKDQEASNHNAAETGNNQGPEQKRFLEKAVILSKAIEHIRHLERYNARLSKERQELKGRVETFEMMVSRTDSAPNADSAFSSMQSHC